MTFQIEVNVYDMNETSNLKWLVIGDTTPPKRNSGLDAGWDVYVPNMTSEYAQKIHDKNPGQPIKWSIVGPGPKEGESLNEGFFIQLNPGQDILLPTYLKSRFNKEWVMICNNKSGVATLQKLDVGANVIDSSYEGEIHVHVFNTSPLPQFISFGQKVAQMVMTRQDCEEGELWYDESLKAHEDKKNRTTPEKFYEGHESGRKDKGFGQGTGGGAAPVEDQPVITRVE